MKKKYLTPPEIYVIEIDDEVTLLSGSADVSPQEIGTNDGLGSRIQLSKHHTLFDDDDDDDSGNDW